MTTRAAFGCLSVFRSRAEVRPLIALAAITAATALTIWILIKPRPAFVWPVDLCIGPERHLVPCIHYDREREA